MRWLGEIVLLSGLVLILEEVLGSLLTTVESMASKDLIEEQVKLDCRLIIENV